MAITKTKMTMPNGEKAIRIDGFGPDPIFLKVLRGESGPVTNDTGTHFYIKAHAQELDSAGKEIVDSTGPVFSTTKDQLGIVPDPNAILKAQQRVRREAVNAFLAKKRIEAQDVPDNLSDVEGEL